MKVIRSAMISTGLIVFCASAQSEPTIGLTTVIDAVVEGENLTTDTKGLGLTCVLWRTPSDDMQTPVSTATSEFVEVDEEGFASGSVRVILSEPSGQASRAPFYNCSLRVKTTSGITTPVENLAIRPTHRIALPLAGNVLVNRGPVKRPEPSETDLELAEINFEPVLSDLVKLPRKLTVGTDAVKPVIDPSQLQNSFSRLVTIEDKFFMKGARQPDWITIDSPLIFSLRREFSTPRSALTSVACNPKTDPNGCK